MNNSANPLFSIRPHISRADYILFSFAKTISTYLSGLLLRKFVDFSSKQFTISAHNIRPIICKIVVLSLSCVIDLIDTLIYNYLEDLEF